MKRSQRKLFAIADEIARLDSEEAAVDAELGEHRQIADDAVRDAVVSGREGDRLDAEQSKADVRRFERRLAEIERRRAKLEDARTKLLNRLYD
jgi:cob(I)alamin adenosyltransferase